MNNSNANDETGLICANILYYLMKKLKINTINYSTLGLRYGTML